MVADENAPEQVKAAKSAIRAVGERMEQDQTLENVGWDDVTGLIDALVPIFEQHADAPEPTPNLAPPRRVVRINGDRHESVLTELRGQFRVICGCRWSSDFGRMEDVERDHDAHLREVDRGEI